MGQCMSRKAAGAFAASAAVSHNRPSKMQRHQYQVKYLLSSFLKYEMSLNILILNASATKM